MRLMVLNLRGKRRTMRLMVLNLREKRGLYAPHLSSYVHIGRHTTVHIRWVHGREATRGGIYTRRYLPREARRGIYTRFTSQGG